MVDIVDGKLVEVFDFKKLELIGGESRLKDRKEILDINRGKDDS